MSGRILLLEDDPNLGLIVQEHLQLNGYEVTLCVNGKEGLERFGKERFALCLVDVMMPKMDGFSFAREIRRLEPEIPLIFLTAKSLKQDRIEGFRIGCDDYITKPFSVEELLLRIQAVLRRSGGSVLDSDKAEFELGKYNFDYLARTLTEGPNVVKLTAREADLLRLLSLHLNKTLQRNLALREIWGDESYFNARSMDVFISRLRKYLKGDPRVSIDTVHGVGFKLTVR